MENRQIYPVFVPKGDDIDDGMEYSALIDWCYSNLDDSNVLILKLEDLHILQKSKALDIINEIGECMLHEGEDDWIIGRVIQNKIIEELQKLILNMEPDREFEIIKKIIDLFKVASNTGKNIYFLW